MHYISSVTGSNRSESRVNTALQSLKEVLTTPGSTVILTAWRGQQVVMDESIETVIFSRKSCVGPGFGFCVSSSVWSSGVSVDSCVWMIWNNVWYDLFVQLYSQLSTEELIILRIDSQFACWSSDLVRLSSCANFCILPLILTSPSYKQCTMAAQSTFSEQSWSIWVRSVWQVLGLT